MFYIKENLNDTTSISGDQQRKRILPLPAVRCRSAG